MYEGGNVKVDGRLDVFFTEDENIAIPDPLFFTFEATKDVNVSRDLIYAQLANPDKFKQFDFSNAEIVSD